jgi:hypothetical protein
MDELGESQSTGTSAGGERIDRQQATSSIPLKPGLNEIEALVPAEWIGARTGQGVVVVGYEVQGVPVSQYSEPIACDLKGVRVCFWKGEVGYREDVKVTRFWIDEQSCFNVVDPEPTRILQTPDGIYALFISPFTVAMGSNAGERIAEDRIDIAVGLLGSFQGRNIVFRKMYVNTYSFETKRAAAWSEAIPVPLSFRPPRLTAEGVRPVLEAEKAIWSLSEPERNRVHLSLKWFRDAMFDLGVNAFLKYWFAIETLSMPSTTDIGPLNDILRDVYCLTSRMEASAHFHTGLLFGLRGRIVHDGKIVPIDGRILLYLEYLYHDILRQLLQIPSERRLEHLLRASGYDYAAQLRKLATM